MTDALLEIMAGEDVDIGDLEDELADAPFLTRRQAEVVARRSQGWNNQEVADDLGIDPQTVSEYMGTARQRIKDSRVALDAINELDI